MPSDDNYDTIMHGKQNKAEKPNKTRHKHYQRQRRERGRGEGEGKRKRKTEAVTE